MHHPTPRKASAPTFLLPTSPASASRAVPERPATTRGVPRRPTSNGARVSLPTKTPPPNSRIRAKLAPLSLPPGTFMKIEVDEPRVPDATGVPSTSTATAAHAQPPYPGRPVLFKALKKLGVNKVAASLEWDMLVDPELGFDATAATTSYLASHLGKDADLYYFLWVAAKKVMSDCTQSSSSANMSDLTSAVHEQFLAELGNGLMDLVEGPHITYIDVRRHTSAERIRRDAQSLVARFEKLGRDRSAFLVSIPATPEGIEATRLLKEQDRINVNLTYVSGVRRLSACAAAGAAAVTVPIRLMSRWYELKRDAVAPSEREDPVISHVQSMRAFLDINKLPTALIGGIMPSAGYACPLVTFDSLSFDHAQANSARRWNAYPEMTFKIPERPIGVAKRVRYPMRISNKPLPHNDVSETLLPMGIEKGAAEIEIINGLIKKEIAWQFSIREGGKVPKPVIRSHADTKKRKRESTEVVSIVAPIAARDSALASPGGNGSLSSFLRTTGGEGKECEAGEPPAKRARLDGDQLEQAYNSLRQVLGPTARML